VVERNGANMQDACITTPACPCHKYSTLILMITDSSY